VAHAAEQDVDLDVGRSGIAPLESERRERGRGGLRSEASGREHGKGLSGPGVECSPAAVTAAAADRCPPAIEVPGANASRRREATGEDLQGMAVWSGAAANPAAGRPKLPGEALS
jgi:hypothetical protein